MKLQSSSSKRKHHLCERRARTRLLCSDLVQLSWTAANGSKQSEVVILENLSPQGAGLFTGVPVTEGTEVRLNLKERELLGIVRQCCFRQNGYIIGLQLTPASTDTLLPEHLLDPSLLALD